MTNHEPIQINGETIDPVPVACPACEAKIDAQRALYEGACPECRTDARTLMDGDSDEAPPEDYEPESYKIEA